MINPVNPLFALVTTAMALLTSYIITKRYGVPPFQGRFASIDGLRGYLAFAVFLHHSAVWYNYLHTSVWKVPRSNLFTHFGQSSVSLFFMITGFLFFSKLIDGRTRKVDWGKLFISRLFRLMPLYLFVVALLLVVVACLSHGIIKDPAPRLAKDVIKWLGFTVLGDPDVNGIAHTRAIIAGVTWSLRYEWLFYFSLPILALTVRTSPPYPYIALGAAIVAALVMTNPPKPIYLLSFPGGIVAAIVARFPLAQKIATQKISSLVVAGCLASTVVFYQTAYACGPLILLTMAFILIACGADLFGILLRPVSRTLGELTYSIYLLHGITLFVVFNFVVGVDNARMLSPVWHWTLIVGITPILILGSFGTFRLVETPAMQCTPRFMVWLRSLGHRETRVVSPTTEI